MFKMKTKTKLRQVKLSALDTTYIRQVRGGELLEEHVVELMEHFEATPAVMVFDVGGVLCLADGWHRVTAAERLGKRCVAAEVRRGSLVEFQDFTDTWNTTANHGLVLTFKQTQEACLRVYQRHISELKKLSAREMGRQLGARFGKSWRTVLNWIEEFEGDKNLSVDASGARASAENRAAEKDVKAVVLGFNQWLRSVEVKRGKPEEWSAAFRASVKRELEPMVVLHQSL